MSGEHQPTTSAGRSHRLLSRSGSGRRVRAAFNPVAIRAMEALLRRLTSDSLTIERPGRRGWVSTTYGPGRSAIEGDKTVEASLRILDERAWTAVATEGSAGLGRGYVEGWWDSDDPVAVVRVLARNFDTINAIRNRITTVTAPVSTPARRLLPSPDRGRNREDIASHYDLGNEFFALFLDDTMTYSSAVFESPSASLAAASKAKYDRLLDKLDVGPGHHLLEIGTGWGGMALRAAGRRDARVTTTTISQAQLNEAGRRVAEAVAAGSVPADRVTLLDEHWRDLDGRHDRIVSIEMIEAVDWRDYDEFFATIERCLAPDGMVGLQAICLPDQRWERAKNTDDFIRRFVFPGGFLPSLGAITASVGRATRMQVLDVEDLSIHYAETLARWRQRFEDRLDEVTALGLDQRFQRLWRFYLAYCEAGFRERQCTVNQIVLVGRHWRPDGLWLRPS